MKDKQKIIQTPRQEFNRWEELLATLSEEQINAPQLPADWSIKDVIAHLRAWQQRSIARLQAALLNKEPEFPKWPDELNPEAEGQPHELNAWIYDTYREQPWSSVYQDWRAGFLQFLDLAEAIPQPDLFDTKKYPWMGGYALSAVLEGSSGHHQEHRESLLAWLREHGNTKTAR